MNKFVEIKTGDNTQPLLLNIDAIFQVKSQTEGVEITFMPQMQMETKKYPLADFISIKKALIIT